MGLNETLQNLTDIANQTIIQPVTAAATSQGPNVLQQVGNTIRGLISGIVPGYELWIVLAASALAGWYIQRRIEQNTMTRFAVWITLTLLAFMALKYVGL